jgi:hypothetical protein
MEKDTAYLLVDRVKIDAKCGRTAGQMFGCRILKQNIIK